MKNINVSGAGSASPVQISLLSITIHFANLLANVVRRDNMNKN